MLAGVNYIDIIIVAVLATQIVSGVRQGFWPLLVRLASFAVGIAVAFWGYQQAGALLLSYFSLIPPLAYALGFIGLFIFVQLLAHFILGGIGSLVPDSWHSSLVSRLLAVVPASVDAFILVSFMLLLIIVLPVPPWLRADVNDSRAGATILSAMQVAEQYAQHVTNGALDRAFTFFTVKPDDTESIAIPYRPSSLSVDEESELEMLGLINAERAKEGAPPLSIDPVLTEIARAHSRDMWERGYFSHYNPDGDDPFDRIRAGGGQFILAGENLAFASTLGLAHRGLMNSPGHRRNILQPRFGRVGIGVIDGGIYGKMFTQNFAD